MNLVESGALLSVPVALRRLRSDESPYSGVLCAGEPASVCVEDTDLPEVVWRADPAGHLLAPTEVLRTASGVAAVLPHCARRLSTDDAASPGQIVTVAVSVVRAARDAAALGEECGTWWVAVDGRPVLALGVGGLWRDEAATILDGIAGATTTQILRRAVHDIARGIASEPSVRRSADSWEDMLFAAAEPAPLRAPGSAPMALLDEAAAIPQRASTVGRTVSTSAPETWISRLVDADVARRTGAAITAVREGAARVVRHIRPRRRPITTDSSSPPPPRRRGPILAAVAVAAVVATAGVLWPSDSSSEASPEASTATPIASEVPAPATDPAAAEADAASDSSSLERDGRRALDLLARCVAGDTEACSAVREDPTRPLPEGLVAAPQAISALEVLDEYGGVAVLRVDGAGFTSQAVVLVQTDEGLLVRDVYDLADQQ